jgi:hypothetical protein
MVYSSNLKMEAVRTSEMSVNYQITRRNFPEYIDLHCYHRENSKLQAVKLLVRHGGFTVTTVSRFSWNAQRRDAYSWFLKILVKDARRAAAAGGTCAVCPFQDDVDIVAYRPVSRQRLRNKERNNIRCWATDFNKQEEMATARERLGKHVNAAMNTHAAVEERCFPLACAEML